MEKQTSAYIVCEFWRPAHHESDLDTRYRKSVDCVFAAKSMAKDHAKLMEENAKETGLDTYYEVEEVMYVGK